MKFTNAYIKAFVPKKPYITVDEIAKNLDFQQGLLKNISPC